LLTNLANHLQPILRYDLGDRVTRLPLPCPCGSPFMAIRVDGRDDDILELADRNGRVVRIAPLVLVGVLEDIAHIHAFQLIRMDATHLELRLDLPGLAKGVASDDPGRRAQAALETLLAAHGLPDIEIVPGDQPPIRHPLSGKLRRVMVCAPGLAHDRLTPDTADELLYDDVLWVQQARRDHYDFVAKMEDRDVEVLQFDNLLEDIMDNPEARSWVLDRKITPDQVGIGISTEVRPWLDEMSAKDLAELMIAGQKSSIAFEATVQVRNKMVDAYKTIMNMPV
jgi:hypothetical protein